MAELQQLFRDAYDFVKIFLLLDRVEHKCRERFAGKSETHLGRGTLPASIGRVVFLSETWRSGDCPVETASLHNFFHGTRIAHMTAQDKTDDSIGNPGKMRCCRKNEQALHSCTVHGACSRKCAVVEKRDWFEDFSRS